MTKQDNKNTAHTHSVTKREKEQSREIRTFIDREPSSLLHHGHSHNLRGSRSNRHDTPLSALRRQNVIASHPDSRRLTAMTGLTHEPPVSTT